MLSDNQNFPIIWVPIFIPDGAPLSEILWLSVLASDTPATTMGGNGR
jgi:hypothetical protein